MGYPSYDLTFKQFQERNAERCKAAFKSCDKWQMAEWALAIAGEAGELCNLLKKVNRGDFPIAKVRKEILKELADIITYCDLSMTVMGADTETELTEKFDEVSARVGFTGREDVATLPPPPQAEKGR